ncbi:uncharacterized protein RJT20DRAFT_123951 [Scheffersomyces xylosifermentans]|uniref:uncharacterized protein n=1 Tax=Scheffersomyces xylosifermentans TaxID=1304137 RepID=UPI00315D7753
MTFKIRRSLRHVSIKRLYTTESSTFFSHPPLNYETYERRLKAAPRYISQNPGLSAAALIDCIKANRILQQQNIELKASSRHHNNTKYTDNFLHLKLSPRNVSLEKRLYGFVFQENASHSLPNSEVIKTYLTTPPLPNDTNRVFDISVANFSKRVKMSKPDTSVIFSVLRLLLDKKDYYNGFKLMDLTFNSSTYIDYKKEMTMKAIVGACSLLAVASAIEYTCLPMIPLVVWVSVNAITMGSVFYGMLKLRTPEHLGRLSWRPYVSSFYKYMHKDEFFGINSIVTHFEEHNEVNIRNYHHSKVRKASIMNSFDHNEYVIELPNDNVELASLDRSLPTSTFIEDSEIIQLQQYFKQEFSKRKMVLNDLPEELVFLEFWLTHGENFEWVEPDQDPAEILKLDIKNKPMK